MKTLLAVGLLCVSSVAFPGKVTYSNPETLGQLVAQCDGNAETDKEVMWVGYCAGLVDATVMALLGIAGTPGSDPGPFRICVDADQLGKVNKVAAYLRAHPEMHTWPPAMGVIAAVVKSFPCRNN